MTALELAANGVTAASILLAARNSIHTWWTGIVGAVLFAGLFWESRLYADVTLQAFFVATSVAGWVQWRGRGAHAALAVRRTSARIVVLAVAGGVAVSLAYGALLHRFTDAYAPFWDSAVLVASVIAQFLLMNRRIECWYGWLLVNTIAVPLYASRDLWLTAALYAAYWINAALALPRWRRELA